MQQLGIVHLSDLHFGDPHFFQLPIPPDGVPAASKRPSLLDALSRDLNNPDLRDLAPGLPESAGSGHLDMPMIVAISGDLTQTAGTKEFQQASKFIEGLGQVTVLGSNLTKKNIFVVPGNHDVIFDELDIGRRWYPFSRFYEQHTGVRVDAENPSSLTRVIDRSDEGFIVVEFNSCVYVQKGSVDAIRGQIDEDALYGVKEALRNIPEAKRNAAIKLAIVHHHPIVLPALAEPNRGYDAVVNSQALLGVLQEFGFQLVMHGHKHYPHTFSYDAKCAWSKGAVYPMSVIAGGSIGSRFLPERVANATNVYNFITIKWDSATALARIRIVTRGLVTHGANGHELLPQEWMFRTIATEDQVVGRHMAEVGPFVAEQFAEGDFEAHRKKKYQELRCNMPVVEVMPSLVPGQKYEARLWIVAHAGRKDVPTRVAWSGGKHFPVVVCRREDNPSFCATLAYYGPVLVQVRMYFDDGQVATGYVYARLPGDESIAAPLEAVSGPGVESK